MAAVILVCLFNVLVAGAILRILPTIRGLAQTFRSTHESFEGWTDQAEAALHPFPQELASLRRILKQVLVALAVNQQRLQGSRSALNFIRRNLWR